jgi:D-galacturonate reductase
MTKPLNVLIVGTGMYVCGRGTGGLGTVLPTVAQAQRDGMVGEMLIAATSDASIAQLEEKATQLRERLDAPVQLHAHVVGANGTSYQDLVQMLRQPACAIVVVPDHLHAQIGLELIEANCPVLMVKPLTPTLAEAGQLVDALEERQLYGAVEFHKRFDEANLLLRQTIRDGRLGVLRYINVTFSQRRSIRDTFHAWIDQTNIFQYLGVHYADLIHFLTGALPQRVMATGQPRGVASVSQYDAIQATIEWYVPDTQHTFLSTIATHWIDPDMSSAMSDQKITVVGTEGRYESDQKRRGVQLVTQRNGIEEVNPYFNQIYAGAAGGMGIAGYGPKSIRQFLGDVCGLAAGTTDLATLQRHRPTFQQALVSSAVIDAVRQSVLQDECWIPVKVPQRDMSSMVGQGVAQ